MAHHVGRLILALALASLIGAAIATAQDVKPLSNEDVIEMVKSGLPESTIAGAIQANATNFDVSAAALIKLKKAGVSPKIMDAMLSAVADTSMPSFTVNITGIPGVNADEYEPAIVNLTTTPNNWRLVGATEGKQDATSNAAFDWPIYSSYVEDRVPARSTKISSGNWQTSLGSSLVAGELAWCFGLSRKPRSSQDKMSAETRETDCSSTRCGHLR